ncbi:hypothetical protein K493DRAFT_316502 [Basidiobolus meristosporus CBS 931.73]|uniref:Amino acid transporter transmembrane domain-containing protein n=1 Tax=Basidiobolus meristosporus CBS 931.73 TaxID=1314790 RepID=A0A1Y1Y3H2_9FUNG|nr:hypothetical protein K493DRAFT_241951 [Basidiobolus meristosporus CBS 931.73]ORX92571.1 hypothetical protein K493DRAFT_316502 [Basidiobolus meristosporus CBS 931.73]|eukprot:ORX81387.1 hypothetical protein K493DRAFT_241951 [Basidiobolus meristosporus CBS 931.73]
MTDKASANDFEHQYNIAKKGDELGEVTIQGTRTASSTSAYWHLLCILAGSGSLSLPYVLGTTGWIGVIIIVLCTLFAIYNNILLVRCLYANPEKRMNTYTDIGQASFGIVGKVAVWFFHNSIVIGGPIVYMILAGGNIQQLVSQLGVTLKKEYWIMICAATVFVPFVTFKNIREVTVLSFFGTFTTVFAIIVVVVVSFVGTNHPVPETEPTHTFVSWSHVPLALGSIGFSFGGNVVFPHVEATMKNPKAWNKVMSLSIGSVSILYLLIAICGYYVFGSSVKAPIFESLSTKDPATIAAMILITLHVLLASPIFLFGFVNELEHSFNINQERFSKITYYSIRTVIRTATIFFVGLIAVVVPFFGNVMSLIGALSECMTVFVLPVVCYVKLFGWRRCNVVQLIWFAITIAVGLVGCVWGSIDAIIALKNDFQGKN